MTCEERNDIKLYEGNAQGFRLATKVQRQGKGLELTFATLAAMTKYPFPSRETEKFGFFRSEEEIFSEVAEKTGLTRSSNGWHRHPLAYLVEAADDICNRVIDLQDSARLKLMTWTTVQKYFCEILGRDLEQQSKGKGHAEVLGCEVIKLLSRETSQHFLKHQKALLEGSFSAKTIIPANRIVQLAKIQKWLKKRVFDERQVIDIEVPGFRVLSTLLDSFVQATEEQHSKGRKASKESQLLLKFVPDEFGRGKKATTAYERLLNVLDFVSGMTDSFAVSLYQTITGLALPRL
jgi:dGTPase